MSNPFPDFEGVSKPLSTGLQSKDSLPIKGYTVDQLSDYVKRQLGFPTWNVELSQQQILDCIGNALSKYSIWKPRLLFGAIVLEQSNTKYLVGTDCGQGVVSVDFVESTPTPTEIFYGNLITPAPLMMRGLDEYDAYMRWRKTWMRVTSSRPDWFWDQERKILWIHNPVARYRAGVTAYAGYMDITNLPDFGAMWVKEYSLANAKMLLGEIYLKFSGAIPGPLQNIQLDSGKRDSGEKKMAELEQKLKDSQELTAVSID